MPIPKWPVRLEEPVQYRTCYRCGIEIKPRPKPSCCRDCFRLVQVESKGGLMWK